MGPYGPAPYGPPPYNPYGAAAPGPPRRGSGGKVLALVLAIVAGVFVLFGAGGAVAYFAFLRADDPEQVVADYFEAVRSGDCQGMIDRVTEATWRETGASSEAEAVSDCRAAMAERPGAAPGLALTLDSTRLVSEQDDRATVAATVTVDLSVLGDTGPGSVTETVDYTLHKSGRQWRIHAPGTDFGLEGVPEPAPPETPEVTEPTPPPLAGPDVETDPPPEPGSLGPSPEDLVVSFYGAWQRADCPGMISLSTPEYWTDGAFTSSSDDPTTICEDTIASGEFRTDLTYLNDGEFEVEYDYDTYSVAVATVQVEHGFGDGSPEQFEFTLIDQAGYWTIHGSQRL